MRFFEHQAQARSRTVKLVALYMAAMAATVAALTWVAGLFLTSSADKTNFYFFTAVILAAAMLAASRYRLHELSQGGHVVAEALGGKRIWPEKAGLSERRVLNVVDEMALAAMLPKPKVYLLPDAGINAFAAGMSSRDAVIGITRGAADALSRVELQAVVAHEFSHIANGDMRLNMRLTGWLFGLQMIAVCGKYLMFGTDFRFSGGKHTTDEEARAAVAGCMGSLPLTLLGLALVTVGGMGVLFAGWIQAAISRQREYLADASAVQFTRQTEGMAGALYKIAVAPQHRLLSWHAAEYAHFMFGSIREPDIFDRLSATHPRIIERIRRISPSLANKWQREIASAESSANKWANGVYGGFFTFAAQRKAYEWEKAEADAELNGQQLRADGMRARIGRQRRDYETRCASLEKHAPGIWPALAANGRRSVLVLAAMLSDADVQTALPDNDALGEIFYRRLRQRSLPAAYYPDMLEYLLPYAVAENGAEALLQQAQAVYRANRRASLSQRCLWQLLNAYLGGPSEMPESRSRDVQKQIVCAVGLFQTASDNGAAVSEEDFDAFQTALNQAASWPECRRRETFDSCEALLAQSRNRVAADLLKHTLAVSLDIAAAN